MQGVDTTFFVLLPIQNKMRFKMYPFSNIHFTKAYIKSDKNGSDFSRKYITEKTLHFGVVIVIFLYQDKLLRK